MAVYYDFFNIIWGQHEYHSKRDLAPLKHGTPLISSRGTNQGIYGYYNITPKFKHVISVPSTGSICKAFYQGVDCCIDDDCLVMMPKQKYSVQEMVYFTLLVRKEVHRYNYGRKVTPERLGNTAVPSAIPSWVNQKPLPSFEGIDASLVNSKTQLNVSNWKEFSYTDLFEVKKGKRVLVDEILKKNGKHNFVSAIDYNNGVFCKTNLAPNQQSNVITVNYDGNGVAEAYYQDEPFWALDSVNILYPRFTLTPFIALFLVTLIRKEKFRFNYGRKWHKERMEKSTIFLPVNNNGEPDWEFIENYMMSLQYSREIKRLSIATQ
jgi:hypothetical protein